MTARDAWTQSRVWPNQCGLWNNIHLVRLMVFSFPVNALTAEGYDELLHSEELPHFKSPNQISKEQRNEDSKSEYHVLTLPSPELFCLLTPVLFLPSSCLLALLSLHNPRPQPLLS